MTTRVTLTEGESRSEFWWVEIYQGRDIAAVKALENFQESCRVLCAELMPSDASGGDGALHSPMRSNQIRLFQAYFLFSRH